MHIDPARTGYVPPGSGGWVTLAADDSPTAPPVDPTVTIALDAATVGSVSTVNAVVTGAAANTSGITWQVTPTPANYSSSQVLSGPKAVFKHSARVATVTCRVPRRDGGPDEVATLTITRANGYKANVFPRAYTRGGESMKVEATFRFDTARSGVPCRLVRTTSPGVTTERSVIETRSVDFTAGVDTVLSRDMTFTAPAGTTGHGYEYRWEVDVAAGVVQRSEPLPMWVYGAGTPVQSLDAAPATLDYPAIYTRKATDSGVLTPAAGRTYAEHVAQFLGQWKATNLSAPIGGAWLSFNDYNSTLCWVNLDDPSVPVYRVEQWDQWEWGYVKAGWYGDDPWARPFPRKEIAHIPIPDHAAPSPGTDRSLTIVGMRGGKVDTIWEMWLAQKMGDGSWRAASIGRTTAADEWRHSQGYTVAASGISALAYALRVKETKAAVDYIRAERAAGRTPSETEIVNRVPHALAINLPNPRKWPNWSYPATFSDGGHEDTAAPWEGQLVSVRSDANIAAENLTPLKHAIAAVMKHRGARITDKTSWSTTMIVESDQPYGGNIWSTIREPGEDWAVKFPDDWFVLGKVYPADASDSTARAAFHADTTTGTAPTPPQAATLPFTDRLNVPFSGAGQSSQIHTFAAGRQAGAGLVVWLHGDAAYEFNNPSSTYVMGGSAGVREVCRQRGFVLVSALAPDTVGAVTWWENGLTKADYLKALLDSMISGYAINPSRVVLAGFSGGAQQIGQFFMRGHPEFFSRGGLTVCIGGGQAPSTTPTYSTAVKGALAMHWAAGANDTAANSSDGFDGRAAATNGEAWYRARGFSRTSLQIIANKGHDIGTFGTVLANQLDTHLPTN